MVMSDRPAEWSDPVDPALLARIDVRAALAAHEIGTFYRVLGAHGSEPAQDRQGDQGPAVRDLRDRPGPQVIGYDVLVRIAEGLGIPRERMGLSFGAYAGEVTTAESSKRAPTAGRPAPLWRSRSGRTSGSPWTPPTPRGTPCERRCLTCTPSPDGAVTMPVPLSGRTITLAGQWTPRHRRERRLPGGVRDAARRNDAHRPVRAEQRAEATSAR